MVKYITIPESEYNLIKSAYDSLCESRYVSTNIQINSLEDIRITKHPVNENEVLKTQAKEIDDFKKEVIELESYIYKLKKRNILQRIFNTK
jgi:hypothetical protein